MVYRERGLSWKIAATFIGAVVGAGFASGQELGQFFLGYGSVGSYGIICSGLLFAIWGAVICELSARCRLTDYSDYLRFLLGGRAAFCIDLLISLYLFCTVFIMLSAGNALFTEHLGLHAGCGGWLTGIVALAVLWGGLESLVSFNVFLVPLKFLVCLAVFLLSRSLNGLAIQPGTVQIASMAPIFPHWVGATLFYAGFNMLGAMVVLVPLSQRGLARQRLAGNLLGGMGLAVFALLIFHILLPFRDQVANWEVPVLVVAGLVHPSLQWFYFVVLWAAILSTAVVSCYGVAMRLRWYLSYRLALALILGISLFFARLQFSSLVRLIYPLFGGVGVLLLMVQGVRAMGHGLRR
ncbi:MAG: hypothetical protein ABSC17_10350 [Thermacetogeniaceae bacterium]